MSLRPASKKSAGKLRDSSLEPFADRADLRRAALAAREAMPAETHARACAEIESHLAALLLPRPAAALAFFWPVKSEFDCRPLVMRLLASGWRACLPMAQAPATAMPFRNWTPGAAMAADCYGIPVPAEDEPLIPDIVLLPLVAFDEAGYRLGYGGGHFDRTLAALDPRPFAVGVGFEGMRVGSIRPEPHDIPLDAIVTEIGVELHPR